MKKYITTYTSRKDSSKVYTHVLTNPDGTITVRCQDGTTKQYSESTLKKNYKWDTVEVEEPKVEEKPLTKHQQAARENIYHGYNYTVGGMENDVQDGNTEELPPIEDMFEAVYDEVTSCTFGEGFCDSKGAPICMKFAGKAFIREEIASLFRKEGYEVPEELVKVPEKKSGHSNYVNGERINLRKDEAERVVRVRAFTGMLIGTFKVEKETKTAVVVKTAKGLLKFSKETGIQIGSNNEKFANRIEF